MSWRFVVYGFVLIMMMHFRPQGVLGWRSRRKYPIPGGIKKPYRIIEVEE
jgi:branched-chain amino acid transport system permease protein